jgi:hypothetical protein
MDSLFFVSLIYKAFFLSIYVLLLLIRFKTPFVFF